MRICKKGAGRRIFTSAALSIVINKSLLALEALQSLAARCSVLLSCRCVGLLLGGPSWFRWVGAGFDVLALVMADTSYVFGSELISFHIWTFSGTLIYVIYYY